MDNNGEHNGQGDGAPIGAALEKARRERGLSLHDVEHATKIRTRYLEGLEREDFSVLPDAVYVQGFLKTYANFLGLDGDEMARELKNRRSPRRERQQAAYEQRPQNSEFERPILSPGGLAGAERRKLPAAAILTVALAVLVLAAVIGALYYIGVRSASAPEGPEAQGGGAPEQPAPERPERDAAQPDVAEERASAQPPAAPRESDEQAAETVSVTVSVLDSVAGLTVSADGAVVADLQAQPGYSQTFEAREAVTVSTANAGAVEVEVDGQDLGRLGDFGQPVTREYTPDS